MQPLIPVEGRGFLWALSSQADHSWPQADKSTLGFSTGEGAAQQPPQARMGVALFPIWGILALPLLGWFPRGLLGSLLFGGSGGYSHWDVRLSFLNYGGGHPLQRSYTLENFFIQKGEVVTHLLLQLLYTFSQPTWLPSSRQIRLLHPILKDMGIGYHLLPPYLFDISTSKDSIWRQLETPSKEAWWGRGAWQWYFHFLHPTGPVGMAKWDSYFPCQPFAVGHPWHC